MARYLLQSRDWIFVEGYGFLSFAGNMGRNIGLKNSTSNLIGNKIADKIAIVSKTLPKKNSENN